MPDRNNHLQRQFRERFHNELKLFFLKSEPQGMLAKNSQKMRIGLQKCGKGFAMHYFFLEKATNFALEGVQS